MKTASSAVNRSRTGIYMAFPTVPVLKPIYRKLKTQVNNQHTKVGITTDSFANREREYKKTFNQEVEFIPLVEVPSERLHQIESVLLFALTKRYAKVGRAREWFNTTDRETIAEMVMSISQSEMGK